MGRWRGFTLLELLVTVTVLAVLATVGIPSLQTLIRANRLTTQTNELVTALNMARAEAVKRGRNVQVDVSPQENGWAATVAMAGADGDVLRVIDRQESNVILLGLAEDTTVTFAPTGTSTDTITFNLQPKSGCSGLQRRQIIVGASGHLATSKQACQ